MATKAISYPLLLLLSFVAGWADMATFVGLDYLMSAHVTGNIVVFAAQSVDGVDLSDSLKIAMIPVFFATVLGTTVLHDLYTKRWPAVDPVLALLRAEAVLLIFGGAAAYVTPRWWPGLCPFCLDVHTATVIVVAMALQNTAHRLYPLGTPTTVMTGNITQFGIDWIRRRRGKNGMSPLESALPAQVAVFAAGCMLSAFMTHRVGVVSTVVPGVMLFGSLMLEKAGKRVV